MWRAGKPKSNPPGEPREILGNSLFLHKNTGAGLGFDYQGLAESVRAGDGFKHRPATVMVIGGWPGQSRVNSKNCDLKVFQRTQQLFRPAVSG